MTGEKNGITERKTDSRIALFIIIPRVKVQNHHGVNRWAAIAFTLAFPLSPLHLFPQTFFNGM